MACIAAVVFIVVIFYLRKTAALDNQEWDIETLTASDFTVEYTISEEMWNLFNLQLGAHSALPAGSCSPDHG